ncbi:MAG: hypothetical protein JW724_03005 [Candidatus Altiarchaeota archaeon]|nr:hypothetical protein [Candidatus Altiarchaeota archaeon]
MFKNHYITSCNFVNRNFAWMFKGLELEWNKELEESLEFIRLGPTPKEITLFAWFAGLLLVILSLFGAFIALFLGLNALYVLFIGVVLACITLYLIPMYPVRMVVLEKMKCLAYAPRLTAYLIITLKQDPNLEKAVKFTAENGDDYMSQDLRKIIWHTWSGKYNSVGEALPILGQKWGDHVKGFRDALYAIRSSQAEKYEHRRLNTLDRALKDLLENITIKFKEFANDLRVPTMVLFMGGVLIPMVVIMFLPVLSMMGFEFGKPSYVLLILAGIVVCIFTVSEYILARRPVAFSAIKVPDDHPDLPTPGMIRIGSRECSLKKCSVGAVILISLLSAPYFLGFQHEIILQWNTFPIVAGVFTGLWIYYFFDSRDKLKVRNAIEKAEDDSIESCFHIGNRLLSNIPAEEALLRVSEMLRHPGEESQLSRILENTVRNIKYMNMCMMDAFFDPDRGSLKDVDSGLIHGVFRLFASSIERGVDAAAETLLNTASHFRDIRKVENSLRDQLSYTTSMMKVSVSMIAPALCALSIPLTEAFIRILDKVSAQNAGEEYMTGMTISIISKPQLTPDMLTLMLGGYMLALLVLFTRFTTMLEYGNDNVKIKNEIAKALPRTFIVFTLILFMGRMFFAQMIV